MWFKKESDSMIFSISGWRAIFTESISSDTTTSIQNISEEHLTKIYYGIISYIQAKKTSQPNKHIRIVIGADTRYTGTILLNLASRVLHTLKIETINLGVIPGPVIMAYTRDYTDGFIYFTASHNPPEYNGIKYGSELGKVQSALEHQSMMETFYSYATTHVNIPSEVQALKGDMSHMITNSLNIQDNEEYRKAVHSYQSLIFESVFRGLKNPKEEFRTRLTRYIKAHNNRTIGILWDPNGGARSWKYDEHILNQLGISCMYINNTMGTFNHAILPEGDSLVQASATLKNLNTHVDNKVFWMCAVVCDCDGDRGNTIFVHSSTDGGNSTTKELSAQEVFALALKIELAWERYIQSYIQDFRPIAVAVNGPSSLRCNLIAEEYNATLFRSEVGEANVIALGEYIRTQKYAVPLVGEASNGGTIIHPSLVRDPLCTILSVLKSILWAEELSLDTNINNTIANLPFACSTPTEDFLAKFQLPDMLYRDIIQLLIDNFESHVPHFTKIFQEYDVEIQEYKYFSFVGAHMNLIDINIATDISCGGFAIYFYTKPYAPSVSPYAFVWLRPSGTEPVVRIMADVLGTYAVDIERRLIITWREYLSNVLYP